MLLVTIPPLLSRKIPIDIVGGIAKVTPSIMETDQKILDILASDRFHRFYNGMLKDFLSGNHPAPTEEQVKERINQLFESIID